MQEPRSQAGGNQARRRHRDRGNSLKVSRDLIVLEGYLNGDITKVSTTLEFYVNACRFAQRLLKSRCVV